MGAVTFKAVTSAHQLDGSTDRRRYAYRSLEAVELLDADDEFEEEEIWHTQLGPGDVRQLSLEQLDDFFRLGVISEQTFLWKKGMSEWKRLSTVLDEHPEPTVDEPEESFHVLMDDRSVRVLSLEQLDDFFRIGLLDENTYLWQKGMNGWQKLSLLAGLDEALLPTTVANAPPRDSNLPTTRYNAAPTVVRNVAPSRIAPVPGPIQPELPSAPPVALSLMPTEEPKSGSVTGRWFFRLSVAAALFLTLGRNDALFSVANIVKQGPSYLDTERRTLGGPSFGTTRAVEKLFAEVGGSLEPVRVPIVVAQLTTRPASKSVGLAVPPLNAPPSSAVPRATPTPTPSAVTPTSLVKTPNSPLSGHIAAALLGQPTKPTKPTNTASPSVPRRKKSSKPSGQLSSGNSNYYDPLNGAL